MDETFAMVRETAERVFRDHHEASRAGAETDGWAASLWAEVEALGLTRAHLPEETDGAGMAFGDALALLKLAGEYAVPLPLAEAMLAGWLLQGAGLVVPSGPLTVASASASVDLRPDGDGWRLAGAIPRVPWARHATALVVLHEAGPHVRVALVPAEALDTVPGENLAGEPRDLVLVNARLPASAVAESALGLAALREAGATARALQMAGALARVSAMTVGYAGDRVQFGKPLGKFQAVQQSLAVLASQAVAAGAAADLAAEVVGRSGGRSAAACAKSRAGEAAGIAAALAHQVHGAIGYADEYPLHLFTKRLWAWRDEFGDETEWNGVLGRRLAAAGADGLWRELTAI